MKLNLSASILALLASTGIVKGQCPLPTYVQILAGNDPSIEPLFCSLAEPVKVFFEFAAGKAFAVDPPTYAFVGTCLPQVIAGFVPFLYGMEPTCQPGQHLISPTYTATNGTDLWFGTWAPKFCFDFTTCNYANLDEYMASIFFKADGTFYPGEKNYIENGYNITGHSLPTSQCYDSLKLSQNPGPNAFCSEPAPKCDDISMVDVTIASKKPFSVPICNDGCRGVGNGGDLPEEKIMNILEIVAGFDGLNPYCTSKDTVFTVKRSDNETINASECTPEKAEERAGECTAAPTPAPTVCADSTERFSVTKPDKVTLVTNRSCKWASRKDTWLRCNAWTGAMEKCPLTCKVCGTTPVPTPAPTSTVCADSTERFSVTKPDKVTVVTNRSCKWVARKNRWERCTAWTGAKEKCPLTCKVCS